jgi:hypothetical protein
MAEQLRSNRQGLLRRAARDLLRELDRVTGPDEPETREILRDVVAAIEARREDCSPEKRTSKMAACRASPASRTPGP